MLWRSINFLFPHKTSFSFIFPVLKSISLTKYSYAVRPMIYTKDPRNELTLLSPNDFIANLMGSSSSLLTTGGMTVFSELIDNKDMLEFIAKRLLEKETLDEKEFEELMNEVRSKRTFDNWSNEQ